MKKSKTQKKVPLNTNYGKNVCKNTLNLQKSTKSEKIFKVSKIFKKKGTKM